MGDRTHVTLTIRKEHQAEAEAIIQKVDGCPPDEDFEEIGPDLVLARFFEVNYGNLDFLNELVAAGIAFDSEWDAGGEYAKGGDYARFTETGELQRRELYEGEENPPIGPLLERIDDPEALRTFILDYHERKQILPWDSQVEYGKLYRARQLIQPT